MESLPATIQRVSGPRVATGFLVASAASLSVLTAFLFWMAGDARYLDALVQAPYHLRLRSDVPAAIGDAELFRSYLAMDRRMHRLGPRLALLGALTGIAVVSTIVALAIAAVRTSRSQRWIAFGLLTCWISFALLHSTLDRMFLRHRVMSLLPACQSAASRLSEWSSGNVELPTIGTAKLDMGVRTQIAWIEPRRPYATRREEVGWTIQRSGDGAIHFSIMSREDWQVVRTPPGTAPSEYVDRWNFWRRPIDQVKLEDDWYLVRYGSEERDP